jgi:tetratricopeptide (TPR) repeat protein
MRTSQGSVVLREAGRTVLFDLDQRTQIRLHDFPDDAVRGILSPDAQWFAVGNWQGAKARVWNAKTGRLAKTLPAATSATGYFSPDSKWLIVTTGDEYRFWDTANWQAGPVIPRLNAGGMPGHVAYTPDGNMLAISHTRSIIKLLDASTLEEIATLEAPHPRDLSDLYFSDDSSQLAAASPTQAIQIWDLRLIRRQLAAMDLDWNLPPYPPPPPSGKPLRVHADLGPLADQPKQVKPPQAKLLARYALYTFAIAGCPWHAEPYHQRGHAKEKLNQLEGAVEDFTTALLCEPNHKRRAHLHEVRGIVQWQLASFDQAVADWEQALKLDPNSAGSLNGLAWLYVAGPAEFRAPDKAQALARRAVQLSPRSGNFQQTLAVAYFRQGRYEQAKQAFEAGIAKREGRADAVDLFFLAMCHHHQGDATRASDCYLRALQWQEAKQHQQTASHAETLNAFRAEADALLSKRPE